MVPKGSVLISDGVFIVASPKSMSLGMHFDYCLPDSAIIMLSSFMSLCIIPILCR